jgi:hypothetical protein
MYAIRFGLEGYVHKQFSRRDCVHGLFQALPVLAKCNSVAFIVYWEMLLLFLFLYKKRVILQGVDPRTRMLSQQQRGVVANVQGYPAHIVRRLAGQHNPLDPYDHLVQQRQQLGFPQGKCQWVFLLMMLAVLISKRNIM